jgi:alkylation response protein AidB-like acyl-CoA dehydrogenase
MEWKLADLVTKLEASRSLTYRAAEDAVAQGRIPKPLQTGAANLFSGQISETVISEALQICGANGYQQGHPLEYLYRLQRGWRLAGGTDEIQKNTIARWLKREGVPTILN